MTFACSNRAVALHLLGMCVAVAVAVIITRLFNEAAIGWGIAVVLGAVFAQLTFVAREKLNPVRLVVLPVLLGAVMWAILHYFSS
jgi:Na+-transporting NADH:ubiquinone oxidoreductase subunit NqrD